MIPILIINAHAFRPHNNIRQVDFNATTLGLLIFGAMGVNGIRDSIFATDLNIFSQDFSTPTFS